SSGPKGNQSEFAQATYRHSKADVLIAKARGLEGNLSILAALAGAKPALTGDYAKQADDAKKTFDEALTAARDCYTEAKGLYEKAGAKEEGAQMKEKLQLIAKMLAGMDPRQPKAEEAATPPAGEGAEGEKKADASDKGGEQPAGETKPAPPSPPV